ncbi:MAG: release factor glutamine methyltransferase [Chloroflexi bacterium]|jgi:release factor glutamine methyltransferase|nr:MAG: release factor glutamine methyltransferase [Chloroflexota bacterium]
MRIVDKLLHVEKSLQSYGITESHIEASLLAATALGESRADLYANLYDEIPEKALLALDGFVERRLQREPLAYILQNREFYGLQLGVRHGVFIPRPETELLVDLAIQRIQNRPAQPTPAVVEVGTGCGAISIAIASNVSGVSLYATDISNVALSLAKTNADTHDVGEFVHLVKSDLLTCFIGTIDILIANLPYLESSRIPTLAPEIFLHEPIEALDGGLDGCRLINQLLSQASNLLASDATILLEMDPEQFTVIVEHAKTIWPTAEFTRHYDLSQTDRILEICLNS